MLAPRLPQVGSQPQHPSWGHFAVKGSRPTAAPFRAILPAVSPPGTVGDILVQARAPNVFIKSRRCVHAGG